jgi:hypothetical protein
MQRLSELGLGYDSSLFSLSLSSTLPRALIELHHPPQSNTHLLILPKQESDTPSCPPAIASLG